MLARSLPGVLIAAPLALGGCSSSPIDASRAQAEVACLDHFSKIVHPGTENVSTADDDPDDNVADSNPAFHIAATGQFSVDFPPITNLDHPYRLRCTGDINQRILTSVQIDGVLHRPPPEKWTF